MPQTDRGYPFPDGDDPITDGNDAIQALAERASLLPGIATLSTAQRDALEGVELWTGRVIFNVTVGRLQRWNGTAWVLAAAVDHGDLSGLTDGNPHSQYARLAGDTFTGPVAHDSDLTAVRLRIGTEIVSTSEATTSVSFTDLPTVGPDLVFTAPASSAVTLVTSALMRHAGGGQCLFGWELVRLDTNAVVLAPTASRALVVIATANVHGSYALPIFGLVAGVQYRMRAKYAISGSGSGDFMTRRLSVIPSP
jgi:hypothetical protein